MHQIHIKNFNHLPPSSLLFSFSSKLPLSNKSPSKLQTEKTSSEVISLHYQLWEKVPGQSFLGSCPEKFAERRRHRSITRLISNLDPVLFQSDLRLPCLSATSFGCAPNS